MPESLAPTLKKICVKPSQLILDPNNPRFMTHKDDVVEESNLLDPDQAVRTNDKIYPEGTKGKDPYKIQQLINSIQMNGWLPVDYIFVRKHKPSPKYYVVLEGNRRVTAIREILDSKKTIATVKAQLDHIDVMEVLDDGSDEDLQKKITYLLGVRHHGSLVRWTPFAQARNILTRYLEVADQTTATFKWDKEHGDKVANALSIQTVEVEERVMVYRSMEQIGNMHSIKNSAGGMKDRYYSLCAEPLLSPRKKLKDYIKQDTTSFLLTDESVSRMNTLCHFDQLNRDRAPLSSPLEWRYLDRILDDPDVSERQKNLERVEAGKEQPSVVWADRAAQITPPAWDKWLMQINAILRTITIGADTDSSEAKAAAQNILDLVSKLDTLDAH